MTDIKQEANTNTIQEDLTESREELSPKKQRRTRKSIIRDTLIVLILSPVYFLAIEFIVRLSPYEPKTSPELAAFVNPEWRDDYAFTADPLLFWRFRPNRTLLGAAKNQPEYKIPINNIGFRGKTFPDPSADTSYRIMFVGDSCVFGWDAPVGKNIPERLLQLLGQAYPQQKFHAFQGGVPGYSSYQARVLLDFYGKRYNPHLVIIYLGSNDTSPRVDHSDREIGEKSSGALMRKSMLEKSKLYRLMSSWMRTAMPLREIDTDKIRRKRWRTGPFRVSQEEFTKNLEAMVKLSREQLEAIPLLLTRQDLRRRAPVVQYNEKMRQLAARMNVPLVDVATYFDEDPNRRQLYDEPGKDPVHPNIEGYDAIARLVFEMIQSEGLIPGVKSSNETRS